MVTAASELLIEEVRRHASQQPADIDGEELVERISKAWLGEPPHRAVIAEIVRSLAPGETAPEEATEPEVDDDQIILPSSKAPLPVARRFVDGKFVHDDGLVLRFWRGSFWMWHRSHWLEAEEAELRATVYSFTEHAVCYDDKGKVQPWAPNRYKVGDVLDALRAVTHLPEPIEQPSWLNSGGADRWRPSEIVATSNGLLHVGSRTLAGHTPAYFNRVAVPFAFDPDAPTPQQWLAFLDDLWPDDPDAIAALQEWFGYCISGRTDLHKIVLLIGPTRAGKGVIARVLGALLGRGNVTGPTLASLSTNFGLMDLIGKPLAVISDARLGGANTHQVVERLLSVSGEDMLTIDRKYRDPWTGKLPTRFLVISNELPRFGDASGAIARRFVLLTCHRSWLGHENTRLTEELLGELPGILGWALDGLDRLQRHGQFSEPASSTDAITMLMDSVSPTSAFVRDHLEVGVGHECPVEAVYAAWKGWCLDNGHDRPGTVQTLGRNLRAVVPALKVVRPRDGDDRERRYVGVNVKASSTTTHNVPVRGPVRTEGLVHDGPQPNPLCSPVDNEQDEDEFDVDAPPSGAALPGLPALPTRSQPSKQVAPSEEVALPGAQGLPDSPPVSRDVAEVAEVAEPGAQDEDEFDHDLFEATP